MPDDNKGINRLLEIVAKLRGKDGCPWDREQTLESLKPCLIEESYEVLDAIDSADPDAHQEELGDVLLQIVLQSRIREEENAFRFDDVAEKLADKLIRRHPHVFGDVEANDSKRVLANWEKIKSEERGDISRSVVDGLPRHLPSLQKAQRVQSRVSKVGFDWTEIGDVLGKVEEELEEVKLAMAEGDGAGTADEIGDLLFAVVNLSRFKGVNAELTLAKTIDRFSERFREVERRVREDKKEMVDCSIEELEQYWVAAKEHLNSEG